MNEKQTEKAEAIADDLREHGIYPKGSIRDWIERFHKISPIIGDTYDCESESKIMSLITQLLAEQNDKLNKYCEKKINQAYADAQDGADEATHKAMDEELAEQKKEFVKVLENVLDPTKGDLRGRQQIEEISNFLAR